MLRRQIGYALALLAAFALYVFYSGYTSWMILMVLLVLPFVSLLLFLLAVFTVSIQFDWLEQVLLHEEVLGHIMTSCRAYFPISCIRVRLCLHNEFNEEQLSHSLFLTAGRKGKRYPVVLSFHHIGVIQIQVRDIVCYDLLGLFRKRIACTQESALLVLPQSGDGSSLPWKHLLREREGECETAIVRADGTQDCFSVREYQPGDAFRRIHWKLSAKQGSWMVREFGESAVPIICLTYERTQDLHKQERIYTYLYETASALLAQGISHEISDGTQRNVTSINEEADLLRFMYNLLSGATLPVKTKQSDDERVEGANGATAAQDQTLPISTQADAGLFIDTAGIHIIEGNSES